METSSMSFLVILHLALFVLPAIAVFVRGEFYDFDPDEMEPGYGPHPRPHPAF